MKLQHFLIPGLQIMVGDIVHIEHAAILHQWGRVFRLSQGDIVVVGSGDGILYEGRIEFLSRQKANVHVFRSFMGADQAPCVLYMCSSIIKKDKFEWVVQKVTELGASGCIPIYSQRSEKKGLNLERLSVIAREAAEQCGRGTIPIVTEVCTVADILQKKHVIVLDEDAPALPVADIRATYKEQLYVLVGPEGGWADHERALFKELAIPMYTIGSRTLRAETAAIAAATLLLL